MRCVRDDDDDAICFSLIWLLPLRFKSPGTRLDCNDDNSSVQSVGERYVIARSKIYYYRRRAVVYYIVYNIIQCYTHMSLVVKRWANDLFSSSTTCVPFVYAATLLCYCGEDAKKKKKKTVEHGSQRIIIFYMLLDVRRGNFQRLCNGKRNIIRPNPSSKIRSQRGQRLENE